MQWMFRSGLLVLVLFLTAVSAPNAAPRAGSPIATGQHPRVFFTQGDVPALRERIASLYRQEFQSFLDLLADPARTLDKSQLKIEAHWGAVNYAFVAALGPAELQSLGFRLPAAYATPRALCDAAMSNVTALLPLIAKGKGSGHDTFSQGYPDAVHLPVAVAYDWCHANLAPAARAQIVDAFVAGFDLEWSGKNHANMKVGSNTWLANNATSAWIHDLLGVVAFYGDSYPAPTKQQEMYDAFETFWIDRLQFELTQLYGDTTGWHEGPGYFSEGYLNLGVGLKMFGPAMGVDYFATVPFFSRAPQWIQAIVRPHSMVAGCGKGAEEPCPIYVQQFGDGAAHSFPCKTLVFMAGGLRTSSPENASLAKHLYTDVSPGCKDPFGKAGGLWSNGVLFSFLMGDKDVSSTLPGNTWAPPERLGLGHYSFLNNSTSQVAFFAQPYGMYGHGSQAEGHFTIHKYGELILKPGNSKGGDARIGGTGANLFHNSVGIHKGGADKSLARNGSVLDPGFLARGLRMGQTGEVKAETLAKPFSYVFFDSSKSWIPSTASVSQREFVYLKGPENSEYVITFDRVRVADPATQTKIWKAWVPTQPRFVGGRVTNPRSTKWTAVGTDTVEVTNEQSALKTKTYESAPTHGRLFLRALAPEDAVLSVLGGPEGEYQGGDDDGTIAGGEHEPMTPAMHAYLGWGRLEIRPGAKREYDTFLTAMQFGDSRTLTQMTATEKITSTDHSAIGVHVRDPLNDSIVMFVEDAERVFQLPAVSYTFQPVALQSKHLLVDMMPGQMYYVTRRPEGGRTRVDVETVSKAGAVPVTASADGVVFFELSPLGVVVMKPPSSPTGLRAVR